MLCFKKKKFQERVLFGIKNQEIQMVPRKISGG